MQCDVKEQSTRLIIDGHSADVCVPPACLPALLPARCPHGHAVCLNVDCFAPFIIISLLSDYRVSAGCCACCRLAVCASPKPKDGALKESVFVSSSVDKTVRLWSNTASAPTTPHRTALPVKPLACGAVGV